MMLLPMDPIQVSKDCTHTMHAIPLLLQNWTYPTYEEQRFRTYLGTPGGARLGREGT